jgi:hypothetical protein
MAAYELSVRSRMGVLPRDAYPQSRDKRQRGRTRREMSVDLAVSGINMSAYHVPAQHADAGSSFGDQFREEIRAQLARSLAGGFYGTPQPTPPPTPSPAATPAATGNSWGAAPVATPLTGRGFASFPAQLQTSGQWADLTHQIGSKYLPGQLADVFTRQMALESGNFSQGVIDGRIVSPAGAQGIAQLMPASYPNVNRLDPVASLNAAAQTMRDNLQQFGGDMRKALAAYDAGSATVSSLVQRLGGNWESGLPAETRQYLSAILG